MSYDSLIIEVLINWNDMDITLFRRREKYLLSLTTTTTTLKE